MTYGFMCWTILSFAVLTSPATSSLPASIDVDAVRSIVVQHDGRWMPLDTLARDTVESITGRTMFEGRDPVLWLLAWTFDPVNYQDARLVRIGNAELRAEIGLPADRARFSYNELAANHRFHALLDAMADRPPDHGLDPLEAKVGEINTTLLLLRRVLNNDVIRPVPDPVHPFDKWRPLTDAPDPDAPELAAAVRAWNGLRESFLADDNAAFVSAASALVDALERLPAAHRPNPRKISLEVYYNRLDPFRIAWITMAVGALLAGAASLTAHRLFKVAAVIVMIVGLFVLSYGLLLRWTIAGRIPAANMYESLLFLSWGAAVFGIGSMLLRRDRFVPLTASFVGALTLFLAETLPLDGFIRPIPPVLLDTVWMSIHVPVIMASYAVLALAALIAHAQLVVMAAVPQRMRWTDLIDGLHTWYLHAGCILLAAGVFTGSMWAASSWGRYWGWDPKEVWSLIALLGYLAILHFRAPRDSVPPWVYGLATFLGVLLVAILLRQMGPWSTLELTGLAAGVVACVLFAAMHGPFATAAKSVAAFWLIIMTYVGVNYVLGIGLHSYGFGTGAVVRYMFLLGGIELGFVALCTVVYLLRRDTPVRDVQPQTAA